MSLPHANSRYPEAGQIKAAMEPTRPTADEIKQMPELVRYGRERGWLSDKPQPVDTKVQHRGKRE